MNDGAPLETRSAKGTPVRQVSAFVNLCFLWCGEGRSFSLRSLPSISVFFSLSASKTTLLPAIQVTIESTQPRISLPTHSASLGSPPRVFHSLSPFTTHLFLKHCLTIFPQRYKSYFVYLSLLQEVHGTARFPSRYSKITGNPANTTIYNQEVRYGTHISNISSNRRLQLRG